MTTSPLPVWPRDLDSTRPVILRSWRRSFRAGVPSSRVAPRRVPDDDLARRLEASRELVEAALPRLEWLSRSLEPSEHVAYLTDADGIVLGGACRDASLLEERLLTPGYDWSEAQMGTNGAGTAIAAGRPVVVWGAEHYLEAFRDCTCVGAPIRGSDGKIVGAIDVSSAVQDTPADRVLLVDYVARSIGEKLQSRPVEQDTRAAEEFLAMITHEMRHPLAAIVNGKHLLQEEDPAASATGLRLLDEGVRQLEARVKDFTAFSAALLDRLELDRDPLDLAGLVRNAAELHEGEIRSRGQWLHLQLPASGETTRVRGDEPRLTQVVLNLLENASKYSPEGSPITVEVAGEPAHVAVSVRDRGKGIERDELAMIFELFARAGSAAGPGMGIGLFLARRIVEAHGGRIEVQSDGPGNGALFRFRIPR